MSKQKSRGGMGSHKHAISGKAPKSPKLRMALKLMAEADERKSSHPKLQHQSVRDAMKGESENE